MPEIANIGGRITTYYDQTPTPENVKQIIKNWYSYYAELEDINLEDIYRFEYMIRVLIDSRVLRLFSEEETTEILELCEKYEDLLKHRFYEKNPNFLESDWFPYEGDHF